MCFCSWTTSSASRRLAPGLCGSLGRVVVAQDTLNKEVVRTCPALSQACVASAVVPCDAAGTVAMACWCARVLPLNPQANSEVSALLGRIPSAVGYQPTLATDLGGLQERITTTTKGSITSVQVRAALARPARAAAPARCGTTQSRLLPAHTLRGSAADGGPRRPCTCPRMTLRIPRPPLPSRTWMPPLC